MHNLTEKLWFGKDSSNVEVFDSIITTELKRMRDELESQYQPNPGPGRPIGAILGLEPEKPEGEKVICQDCGKPLYSLHVLDILRCLCKPKEKTMEWCEHIKFDTYWKMGNFKLLDDWKECPICGTPRPKKKELREVLIERFHQVLEDSHNTYPSSKLWRKNVPVFLADACLKTIEEFKHGNPTV